MRHSSRQLCLWAHKTLRSGNYSRIFPVFQVLEAETLSVRQFESGAIACSSLETKKERAVGLSKPTRATVVEVVTAGKVYRLSGATL